MARMKVLLTQDVPELGHAGEVYRVAGGYARNYLMPRGMAVVATAGAMRQAEEIKMVGIRKRAQEKANAEAQAAMVNGRRLLFAANAGDNDRLYGSVTSGDIAEKLSQEVGFEVDRRRIQMDAALRDLGMYELELRMMQDVAGRFTVGVVRDGEGWAQAEERQAKKAALRMAMEGQEAPAE
ncbi:MAG: 50S ribosomal protein L9 [Caldilineaceae bacterium]